MTKLKNLQLQGARATVAEMKTILAVAKDLEFIETGYPEGDYTRKGWKN